MQKKSERLTASNHYISQFYHLAVKHGLDAQGLLDQVDLSLDIIDSPAERIHSCKLATVVENVLDMMDDESMFLSSSRIPRGSFYMMGKLTIQEPNLYKALKLSLRFYAMVTEAFKTELAIEGDNATLKFFMKNPEMDVEHLLAEIILMAWHRYSSWLIAENIVLNKVYFNYPAPNHVAEYTYLFPGRHIFNAPFLGLSFPKKFLDYENVQNAQSINAFMKSCPMELFLQPKTDFSVSGGLQLLLAKRYKEGFPTIKEAADMLYTTKRTLIRKLKQEGTSYQQIKDLVRRDKAIFLLTRSSLSIKEIAEKISFSDPAVFARAFKSWTNLSPREYRTRFSEAEAII